MARKPKMSHTERGFRLGEFVDLYGIECSIQKSSLAGKDAIWLGVTDAKPRVQVPGKNGWYDVELVGTIDGVPQSGEVLLHTRMHLDRDMVKKLLPLLQHFVETGELP